MYVFVNLGLEPIISFALYYLFFFKMNLPIKNKHLNSPMCAIRIGDLIVSVLVSRTVNRGFVGSNTVDYGISSSDSSI